MCQGTLDVYAEVLGNAGLSAQPSNDRNGMAQAIKAAAE
jgi:hypothetical protein